MKKSSRFYLKYNPDNRWSFWTGKWWSLCSEISGQFTPKLGGQFDRLFHLLWANKDFMVIAFRGTEPSVLKDWLTDSKYWNYENAEGYDDELSNMPAGHGGFRRSLMRLMQKENLVEKIKEMIKEVNPEADLKTFPIYLTGHSLGAALAQLFILPLQYHQLNFKGAYHFAPPFGCYLPDQCRNA